MGKAHYLTGHPLYGKQTSSFIGGKGEAQRGPKTLVPLDDGMDVENAVKMSFRHIRECETFPQPFKCLGLDIQEVMVEYTSKEPADKLQELFLWGIRWCDSQDVVTGYRMDKPTTHVRLGGVTKCVSQTVVTMFLSQYGKVSTVYRKGIHRDMVDGSPGLIWDGVRQVHICVTEGLGFPTIILAPIGNWRLKHRDICFLYFNCGSPSHA